MCNRKEFDASCDLASSFHKNPHAFVFHVAEWCFHDCLPSFVKSFALSCSESLCISYLGRSDFFRRKAHPAALLRKERTALLKFTADTKPIGNFDDVSILLEVMYWRETYLDSSYGC